MKLNFMLFGNETGNNETNITESDTKATTHPFLTYLILFGFPLAVVLVVVPALVVIITILKNRKLREKNNNIFYANLLIADVMTILLRWIVTSIIIIFHLLDIPNVNCNVVYVPLSVSVFSSRLMFLPVVINRFLHVALPFSYKRTITTKRVKLIISGFWLLALVCGIISIVGQDYSITPEYGTCLPKNSSITFVLIFLSSVASTCIITGVSIYLHYKIVHVNQFFNSVKRTAAEKQKAVKAGRLVELLQEQVKPTLSVFIAGGIDAAGNGLAFVFLFVGGILDLDLFILRLVTIPIQLCLFFCHAVVYGLRDKTICKDILDVYNKICGPKKSKVIVLHKQ